MMKRDYDVYFFFWGGRGGGGGCFFSVFGFSSVLY